MTDTLASQAAPSVGPSGITPRPVVCVIDGLHNDRDIADDAVAGWFSHAGVRLHLGCRPDWIGGGLADDEEWRIEWIKLYEGLHLASAFHETGAAGYLNVWQDLVESFVEQVPIGLDTSDVSARRIQNWIYAWNRFAAAPGWGGLRHGLDRILVDRLLRDGEHLRANLTPERNHRTLELYALLILGLAFPATVEPDLVDFAMAELTKNAVTDIWTDGVHRECSTDYHMIVLRSLVGAVANAKANAIAVPDELLNRIDRACDFALHAQRPDGLTPALSDGDVADHRATLRLAAELLDRPDLLWAATSGLQGTPPHQRHVTFPVGGYAVQRSGWGEGKQSFADERFLILDAGPLGDGGHGHYDQLSIEAFANGRPLIVDPGRFTYADNTDRRWFKSAEGHNTVTVDGLDPVEYRRGKPKGVLSTATLRHRRTTRCLDSVEADLVTPRYDVVHTRRLLLVDDDWWLVHDRLTSTSLHTYRARWHLAPLPGHARAELRETGGTASVVVPGATLAISASTAADTLVEPGWYSPEYGMRTAAPVVVTTVAGCSNADLVTAIVPTRDEAPITLSVTFGSTMVASVACGGVNARVWWEPGTALCGRSHR